MTEATQEQVSISALNVKMNALLEARAEDLEARKEERQFREQEGKENRAMMNNMAEKIGEMAIAVTEQTKNNEHLNQRVDKVEKRQDAQAAKIEEMDRVQSGNKVRWQVLAAGIAAFITVGGMFLTAFLWLADKLTT